MAREVTVTIETTSAGITVDPGDTRVVRLYRDGDPVPATNGIPSGGTTGQVLAKASNADYDADWVTGGGGAAVWGGITGTLSAQADLQAALDAKEATGTTATHAALTSGVHGITAAGAALTTAASAAAQRTALGLGTAATTAASDYATVAQGALADTATQPADLASAISTHAAATDPHGDRAYTDSAIATKLDDLSAGTADTIVTASADGTLLSRAAYTIATLLAAARDRATHTGTQIAATISDFTAAVQALFGTTAGTVCEGNDARLSDARTPTAHTHPLSDLQQSGATSGQVARWNGSAWAPATPSGGSPGGSSGQIQFNDSGTFGGAPLWREDANTLRQRNGANPQSFSVANTWSDASNYEVCRLSTSPAAGWMRLGPASAGTGSANISMAIGAIGTGALAAQVPDSTAAGGNARGTYSVDWQCSRAAATQVASGTRSTISGGESNTASNNYSFVGGGSLNIASGQWSVVSGGFSNTASGHNSAVVGGGSNSGSGYAAFIGGGAGNVASGVFSWVPGGQYGTTRTLLGAYAWASGRRSATGDSQHIGQIASATTTDTTTTTLTADRAAVGAANVMVLPNNSSLSGIAVISARDTSGNCATWVLAFRVSRGASAATTAVDYQATLSSNLSGALSTCTAVIAADTTQGAAVCNVTGVAATTIDWIFDPSMAQIAR